VTGGITDRISLRLDDAPAEPAIIEIVDYYFANQIACQFHSIHREFGSTETPKTTKGNRFAGVFHKPLRLALLNGMINLRHRPPTNQRGDRFCELLPQPSLRGRN
jgi:hypothetical protein